MIKKVSKKKELLWGIESGLPLGGLVGEAAPTSATRDVAPPSLPLPRKTEWAALGSRRAGLVQVAGAASVEPRHIKARATPPQFLLLEGLLFCEVAPRLTP